MCFFWPTLNKDGESRCVDSDSQSVNTFSYTQSIMLVFWQKMYLSKLLSHTLLMRKCNKSKICHLLPETMDGWLEHDLDHDFASGSMLLLDKQCDGKHCLVSKCYDSC